MTISFERLYGICNRLQWFTGGSTDSYDKLFQLNREGAPLEDLALVIWICSPGRTRESILSILKKEAGR